MKYYEEEPARRPKARISNARTIFVYVLYLSALYGWWSVGGWPAVAAAMLFGWAMNVENKHKEKR